MCVGVLSSGIGVGLGIGSEWSSGGMRSLGHLLFVRQSVGCWNLLANFPLSGFLCPVHGCEVSLVWVMVTNAGVGEVCLEKVL